MIELSTENVVVFSQQYSPLSLTCHLFICDRVGEELNHRTADNVDEDNDDDDADYDDGHFAH